MAAYKIRRNDPRSIVQIALDVHTTAAGSFERSDAAQFYDIGILSTVLDAWDEPTSEFDSAVRMLIETALEEAYSKARQ
jgi:hypothetical protein